MTVLANAGLTTVTSELIRLVDVTKSYGSINVLKPVNLDIKDGEFLTILGPSGSGKTTILRMIGGFTAPTSGQVLLRGTDIVSLPIFKRPFNTVFQDYALFPHMTVAGNVGYGLRIRRLPADEIKAKVRAVLETVNLADKADRYPAALSGGQRQRVALARAIVCEPQVILLDEPLAALDAELRRSMQDFLKQLQRRIRTTFVFITHDQEEAIAMSDRIAVMDHGSLIQVGTPKEIYYKPKSEFVAKFFGENNLLPTTQNGASGIQSPLGIHASSLPAGKELQIAIRPESFSLHDASPCKADQQVTTARLEGLTFLGPTTQLSLSLGNDAAHRIKVRLPTALCTHTLSVGAHVALRWSESDVSFVPREA